MRFIIASLGYCFAFILIINISLGFAMRDNFSIHPLSILDTGSEDKTNILAISEAREALFGTPSLARTSKPKLIFMGASTVRVGFRPEDWSSIMPNLETHNMAVGSMSITALNRLWPHVKQAVPPNVAKHSIIVIGLMYLMIADLTDYISREEPRLNPLYLLGIKWWGTERVWNYVKLQTYRYFGLDAYLQKKLEDFYHFFNDITEKRMARGFIKPLPIKKLALPINPNDHNAALVRFTGMMKDTKVEKKYFIQLKKLIQDIRAKGFKVVIVSMPLPNWHIQMSPYDKPFCDQLHLMMSDLVDRNKGIYFVDLHQNSKEENFRDTVHLNRQGARLLTNQLYKALTDQLIFSEDFDYLAS